MTGKKKSTRKLRVLTFNTHVGLALFVGAIAWLLARIPGVHLVALQEVQSPRARKAARRIFNEKKWHAAMPVGDRVGVVCFAKKKRFRLDHKTEHNISADAGRMFPQRDLIGLTLFDKQTKRRVDFTSIHTWHIVGKRLDQAHPMVYGHIKQVRTHAIHHQISGQEDRNALQICAGDVNEPLRQPPRGPYILSAKGMFSKYAGMVPTYSVTKNGSSWADVDDIFFKEAPFIRCINRRVFKLPFKVVDHKAVYCVFEVDVLEK